jgi:hypothetical protein
MTDATPRPLAQSGTPRSRWAYLAGKWGGRSAANGSFGTPRLKPGADRNGGDALGVSENFKIAFEFPIHRTRRLSGDVHRPTARGPPKAPAELFGPWTGMTRRRKT